MGSVATGRVTQISPVKGTVQREALIVHIAGSKGALDWRTCLAEITALDYRGEVNAALPIYDVMEPANISENV